MYSHRSLLCRLQQCACLYTQSLVKAMKIPCRLEKAHNNAKENVDGTAPDVRPKTEEDAGLQQPVEGRSGMYKPLFWVDLEMTGSLPAQVTPHISMHSWDTCVTLDRHVQAW